MPIIFGLLRFKNERYEDPNRSADMTEQATNENAFHLRDEARHRPRRPSLPPLPSELVVHEDGSAVVAYAEHDRFIRFESLAECLAAHGLVASDLEPA